MEDIGVVWRGVAVPFGEGARVREPSGEIVEEYFDELSIAISGRPRGIPLLLGHDHRAAPAGTVDTSEIVPGVGLVAEGRLVGAPAEIEGWRARWQADLMTRLSIGFSHRGRQEWRRPRRPGDPPRVIRRGVSVAEVSLVTWPAYRSARVESLRQRTARSEKSQAFMEEAAAECAAVDARLAARRK